MENTQILSALTEIKSLIQDLGTGSKEILNFQEATKYLSLSQSYLYKLTSTQQVPHYKPNGKQIYFNKSELDTWLLKGKVKSVQEIEQDAESYVRTNKGIS